MAGMSAQLVSHVVRRGMSEVTMNGLPQHPPKSDVFQFNGIAVASLVALAIFTLLSVASIEYIVGNVVAKLAMIESATTTTIVESAPPAYTDEPDAPLEKKGLLGEADIEIVTIKHKPITTSVKATIAHLHRLGGFFARWRGLRESIVYHFLVNAVSHFLAANVFHSNGVIISQGLGFTVATVLFSRFRMVWTHAMIAAPTGKPWYRRYCSRKRAFALLLPSLVYTLALHATIVAPIATLYMVGAFEYADPDVLRNLTSAQIPVAMAQILSGPAVGLLALLFLVIPANATLTRVEACLLPEDDQIIVPFDSERIMGDIDLTARGSSKQLFAAAWKSVGWSTRGRVLGVYSKMVLFQLGAVLVNSIMAISILYITGPDQLAMLAYAVQP